MYNIVFWTLFFFCIYDFLSLSFTNTIFQSYNNTNKEQEKSKVFLIKIKNKPCKSHTPTSLPAPPTPSL